MYRRLYPPRSRGALRCRHGGGAICTSIHRMKANLSCQVGARVPIYTHSPAWHENPRRHAEFTSHALNWSKAFVIHIS